MNIDKLDWDSDFFGYQIGKTEVSDFHINQFEELISSLRKSEIKLIYVYPLDRVSINSFLKLDVPLAATNLIFEKGDLLKFNLNNNIKSYDEGENFDEIEKLAILSGEYSRFKKDSKFLNNEFIRLYSEWIKKSIRKEIANDVIIYKYGQKISGFISYRINSLNDLVIGLIAVDPSEQGQGIGKSLMQFIENMAANNGIKKIIVTTQLENLKAVAFYNCCGYKLQEKQEIFHLWIH